MQKHWLNDENLNTGKTLEMDRLIELHDYFPDAEESILIPLITEFLKEAPRICSQLRSLFEQGDFHQVHKTAHALKSSCGNLGAFKLSRLCQELEDITEKPHPPPSVVNDMIQQIEQGLVLVERDLKEIFNAASVRLPAN